MVQNLGRISNADRVIAKFMFKYPNFCYHDNRDRSQASLTDIMKLAVPEKSGFGARIWNTCE